MGRAGDLIGRSIDEFLRDLKRNLVRAIDDEAEQIKADERRDVPVGPNAPHLRDNIEIRRDGVLERTVGIFDPKFIYAIWIEWGRKNAAAQPFRTPALAAARYRWRRRVEAAVKDAADAQR